MVEKDTTGFLVQSLNILVKLNCDGVSCNINTKITVLSWMPSLFQVGGIHCHYYYEQVNCFLW